MSTLDLPYIERDINGTVYRATTLNLDDWAALTESLATLLGDPLASIMRGDAVLSRDFERSDIQILIGEFVGKVSKTKIIEMTRHMAKGLRTSEEILSTDKQKLYWPRHMKDFAPVVKLFLEAQYIDFFEGLVGSLPQESAEEGDQNEKESG